MRTPRRIAIRADASPEIGVGHIMRCLVLADELARCGVETAFICRQVTDWAAAQIARRRHGLVRVSAEDAAAIVACGVNVAVVDHYGLQADWCAAAGDAGLRLCAIDDLAEVARPVEMLVDPCPGRQVADYEGLIPPDARCLTGANYGLIRPEFPVLRHNKPPKAGAGRHVIVSMGGSDPAGHSLACLEALDKMAGLRISVVLTGAAPHLAQIRARVDAMKVPTQLLVDHSDMATLVASADLVLGAGGGSALERCVLGVPTLLAVLAPNQQPNASYLEKSGAVEIIADLSPEALRQHINAVLSDPRRLAAMASAAAAVCDGRGGARVALAMLETFWPTMTLRAATAGDMKTVFDWQCVPGMRAYARNPDPPDWATHQDWFLARLTRAGPDPFYIIEAGDTPAGFVRLDQIGDTGRHEVSILLAPDAQGAGLAWAALARVRLMHPTRKISATVHPNNAPSQALFAAAGYAQTGRDAFISLGWPDLAEQARKDETHAD